MTRPEAVEELERRVAEAVQRALAGARFVTPNDLEPLQAAERAEARGAALAELAAVVAALDRATSQAAVLEALLAAAGRFASRSALFLTLPEGAHGWAGRGFGDPSRVAALAIDYDASPWSALREGRGCVELSAAECASLASRLDSPAAQGGALVPLVLRDRVAAALYADRLDDEAPWSLAALQLLVHLAALAIETLPFRARAATPTLALAAEAAAPGLELWQEEEEVEEPARPAAAPEFAAEPEAPAEPAPFAAAAPATETAVPPEPAVTPEPAAAPEPEVSATSAGFSFAADTDDTAPSLAPAEEAVRWEPDSAEEPTLRLPSPPFPAPPETLVTQRIPIQPPAALSPEPGPPMPSSIFPAAGRSAEVAPPPDLLGPGWAFSSGRLPAPGGDEGLHEEARRLARLLVSEIKLYNEEQVEDGRRSRDLYERLREDIDRSRQMYEERVEERIRNTTDYFYQALVSILAGGDARAMGV